MSIATNIQRLMTAKSDIKTAIEGKGVTVPSSATLDTYSTYISNIDTSSGGGDGQSSKYGKFYDNYSGATSGVKVAALIEEVVIPSGITSLNIDMRSTYVKKFKFEEGSQCTAFTDGSFNQVSSLIDADLPPKLTALRSNLFSGTGIKEMTIPSGITSITNSCFSDCHSLSSVTFLNNVITSVGEYAFSHCTSLKTIDLPTTVTTIGGRVFRESTSLTNIVIPSGVTRSEIGWFYGCTSLSACTLPNGLTNISDYMFWNCSSLVDVQIPSTVTTIGTNAFERCAEITSITIPSGVTSIGQSAFAGCYKLGGSIEIPSGVTSINQQAFQNCYELTSVTLNEGLITISGSSFNNCRSLVTLDIPSTVTTIGGNAFNGCTGLTSITFHSTTPPTLSNTGALQYTNNCPIYVPSDSVQAYKSASNWSSHASRIEAIS